MSELYLLLTIESCILGALCARLDGSDIKVPNSIKLTMCMVFFIIACVPSAGFFAALAMLGAIGIATGHGQYFPTLNKAPVEPEKFDFIVQRFFGPDPRNYDNPYSESGLYKRCAFGMFVTGSIVGIPAGLLCILTGNLYGVVLLFTGVAKALGYHLGYKLTGSTEAGEYLNGTLRTLLCMVAFIGGYSAAY